MRKLKQALADDDGDRLEILHQGVEAPWFVCWHSGKPSARWKRIHQGAEKDSRQRFARVADSLGSGESARIVDQTGATVDQMTVRRGKKAPVRLV